MKKIISTNDAPQAVGPYSQAIQLGNLLFCSGQIAINPANNEVLVHADIKAQTEQVMKNIGALLKSVQLDYSHIVKTTIFLTNMNDFAAVNEVYAKYFQSAPPARSTVAVSALPKGVIVEIEVIAAQNS